jgi:hypothetical protein
MVECVDHKSRCCNEPAPHVKTAFTNELKKLLDSLTYADELSGAGGYLYNGLMDNLNVPPPHPF